MAIEVSGEVSLEAPADLAVGLAFCAAPVGVGAGFGVVDHPDHGDDVQFAAEAPVASAVEPVPGGVA